MKQSKRYSSEVRERAGDKSAIHRVSAWASENSVVLGQTKTENKSNEITAIPQTPIMAGSKPAAPG